MSLASLPISVPALVAAGVAACVAVVGMRVTALGRWYRELRKPSWQPPDWLFGPVWTTVYICSVTSVTIAWPKLTPADRVPYLLAWALNVALNIWWSVLFFRRRRPDLAFVEVWALWGSIVLVGVLTWRASPGAGWFIVPYLAWVSFAAYLNRVIVLLNAPFLPE